MSARGHSSRRGRTSLKRAFRRRPLKRTVLIVGEGRETEPNYFRSLRDEECVSRGFAITVKKGKGQGPTPAVKRAIDEVSQRKNWNRKEPYDEVWAVIDVEGPPNRNALEEARRLAATEGISLCLSNPCFEVWLLAHFERTARSYLDSEAVIRDLDRHWQTVCGRPYAKNDPQVYASVQDRTSEAIENARLVREKDHQGKEDTADCNSSTEVYLIVSHLLGVESSTQKGP